MKNSLYRYVALAVLSATVAIASTGCKPQLNNGPAQVTVKWGGPKNISMLPLVADAQGLFSKHQVKATFVDIQTGKKAMDALRTGDVDLGILVDSNLAFAGLDGATDLQILACVMTKRDDALLVLSEGFRVPTDIRGLTVGVTLGTTSHAYLVQWLEANGMKPSEVTLQNMPPPAIQAALLNGTLKAGCLWQPFRYSVLTSKPGVFTELKDPKVYQSYVLLVATKRYLEGPTGPATAMNFIRAILEAEAYVAQNDESTQRMIGETLGIPTDVMKAIWSEYDLRAFLDNDVLSLLDREGRWISESVPEHINKAVPNYRPFMHPEILRSIDAGRVKGL